MKVQEDSGGFLYLCCFPSLAGGAWLSVGSEQLDLLSLHYRCWACTSLTGLSPLELLQAQTIYHHTSSTSGPVSSQTGVSADNRGPVWLRAGCLHLHAKLLSWTIVFVPVSMHWSVTSHLSWRKAVWTPPSPLVLGDVRLTSKTLLSIRVHPGTQRFSMAAGANHWGINVSIPPLGFVLPTVTVDRSKI